jgi:hypothetical protein
MRDFSSKTIAALARKGIKLIGLQVIPAVVNGVADFANADRGYRLNDNGTGRVLTFKEVLALV